MEPVKNITKAREILHWEPKVSLYEGITKTYYFIKEELLNQSHTSS